MASYDLTHKHQNDLERGAGMAVMYLPTENPDGELYKDGDIVLLGSVPKESYTYLAIMDVHEGYFSQGGVKLAISHPVWDENGQIVGVNIFDKLDADTWVPKAITLPTQLDDSHGNPNFKVISAWGGDVEIAIKFELNGGHLMPGGVMRLAFGYCYFGAKTGNCIQGALPMQPYKQ